MRPQIQHLFVRHNQHVPPSFALDAVDVNDKGAVGGTQNRKPSGNATLPPGSAKSELIDRNKPVLILI
jgi:hypothetical protein